MVGVGPADRAKHHAETAPVKAIPQELEKKLLNVALPQIFADKPPVKVQEIKKVSNESGTSAQMSVVLEEGSVKVHARVKQTGLNEALSYYNIAKSDDAIQAYVPRLFTVLDKDMKPLDLNKVQQELETTARPQDIYKKYAKVHIVLSDLVKGLEEELIDEPKDFKFAKPSLVGSDIEAEKHGDKLPSSLYKFIRKCFFGLSKSAFAYQQSTASSNFFSWFINSIKRALTVKATKQEMQKLFKKMQPRELEKNIEALTQFRADILKSQYTFADSSLLFIPVKQKDGTVDLKIRMIDLAKGLQEHEGGEEFYQMRRDMADSIQELIDMMSACLHKS